MFSCEETWDVFLTFGRIKRHVRTFTLKLTDPSRLHQPVGTLWFKLPKCAEPIDCNFDGIACVPVKEDGLNRSISISFERTEGRVRISFDTQEDTPEGSIIVDFVYPNPQRWHGMHDLKVVFHLPIGFPQKWIQRLGVFALLFPTDNNRLVVATSRLPYAVQVFLRSLKEYYCLPWGCKIKYGTTTKEGRLHSLLYTPRRLVYDEEATEWIRKGQSNLYFEVSPQPLVENLIVAGILGFLIDRYVPFLPLWGIIVILILLLPIFSRGLVWRFLHLFK